MLFRFENIIHLKTSCEKSQHSIFNMMLYTSQTLFSDYTFDLKSSELPNKQNLALVKTHNGRYRDKSFTTIHIQFHLIFIKLAEILTRTGK